MNGALAEFQLLAQPHCHLSHPQAPIALAHRLMSEECSADLEDGPRLYLCRCMLCSKEASEDGSDLGGIYLERPSFQTHQESELRRRSALPSRAEGKKMQSQPPTPSVAQTSPEQAKMNAPSSTKGRRSEKLSLPAEKDLQASRRNLEHLGNATASQIAHFPTPKGRLIFTKDPKEFGDYIRPPLNELVNVNQGPHALATRSQENEGILQQQSQLSMYLQAVQAVPHYDDETMKAEQMRLETTLVKALDQLDYVKELEWNFQHKRPTNDGAVRYEEEGFGVYVECEPYFSQQYHTWHPATLSVFLTVLLLHLFCGLSRRASSLLLTGMQCLTRILRTSSGPTDISHAALPAQFPKDVRTVVRSFDLEPRTHSYVCCPQCFALYPRASCPTFQQTPASPPCDAGLHRTRTIRGKEFTYPIRLYLHQDMKEWVARLYSRPGMEDFLDAPIKKDREDTVADMRDIWDSPTFAKFLGPDKKAFFETKQKGESRLAFALAIDGFNPFQTKAAKQMASVTGMYMVCLNLPPSLRYLPENMYLVGVIPGPSKPSGAEINHFLSLLVDDLLPLWEPGIYLSRTVRHDRGRLVRAVLIPLVCDLLAAKQVSGLSGHQSKYFCTYCLLPLEDIENTDRNSWPPRDLTAHMELAYAWKNAKTQEEQAHIYDTYGVRWSELLRLPYWNPLIFTIIDSMHNLYLGLLQNHCRKLWGMDLKADDGDLTEAIPTANELPRPTPEIMKKAEAALNGPGDPNLNFPKAVLWHLCADRKLRRASTVNALKRTLTKWRERQNKKTQSSQRATQPAPAAQVVGEPHAASSDAHKAVDSPPVPSVSKTNLETARVALQGSSAISHGTLLYYTKAVLEKLCEEAGVPYKRKNKGPIVEGLLAWRTSQGLPVTASTNGVLPQPGPIVRNGAIKHEQEIKLAEAWFETVASLDQAALDHLPLRVLVELCRARGMKVSGPKAGVISRLVDFKKTGKADDQSCNTRRAPQDQQQSSAKSHPAAAGGNQRNPKKSVLGRQILTSLRKDMVKTQLPAWISPAPTNLGTTLHGKLSADQWRTTCLIHLPITLVRLWAHEEGRKADMLSNFVDLIVAVEIGTMRVTSSDHIAMYDQHMLRYIRQMKKLYVDAKVLPNHHMALHLPEFLRSFGSVHAWRSFAFERYNYLLQQEKTNQKFGEIELTYMRHTCRGANLRPIMQDPTVRNSVEELIDAYDQFTGEDRRGTRILDSTVLGSESLVAPLPLNPQEKPMDAVVYQSFASLVDIEYPGQFVIDPAKRMGSQRVLSRNAVSCAKIFISGITYKPFSLSPKDSNIIFDHDETSHAGRLERIYQQVSGPLVSETYLVVRRLRQLSNEDAKHDYYRRFNFGTGALWYDDYDPEFVVIRPTDVVCHFAKTTMDVLGIERPCVHVLPLNIMVSGQTLRELNDGEEADEATDWEWDDSEAPFV